MKLGKLAWMGWATATVLAGVFACSGSTSDAGGGNGSSFPYSGPSCTSSDIPSACWTCLLDKCGSDCITSECSGYFDCYCDCSAGNATCQGQCAVSQTSMACDSCLASVGTCATSTCGSACSGSTITGSSSGSTTGSSSGITTGSSSGISTGSSSGTTTTTFPFSGPSCSGTQFQGECWDCVSSQCQAGCLATACASFYECYCPCPVGDTTCSQTCDSAITSECQTCQSSLVTCLEQGSCLSVCGVDGG